MDNLKPPPSFPCVLQKLFAQLVCSFISIKPTWKEQQGAFFLWSLSDKRRGKEKKKKGKEKQQKRLLPSRGKTKLSRSFEIQRIGSKITSVGDYSSKIASVGDKSSKITSLRGDSPKTTSLVDDNTTNKTPRPQGSKLNTHSFNNSKTSNLSFYFPVQTALKIQYLLPMNGSGCGLCSNAECDTQELQVWGWKGPGALTLCGAESSLTSQAGAAPPPQLQGINQKEQTPVALAFVTTPNRGDEA